VFSATGLYPLSAADARYLVTVPVFDEVRWTMPNGKVLTVKKSGPSRNLSTIQVNGTATNGYFVPHQLFNTGGQLEVVTK
jgi:putative alpha-1,2-mannosidase